VKPLQLPANLLGEVNVSDLIRQGQTVKHPFLCPAAHDPALIKPAIEELLRYGSPMEAATVRYERQDVTIGGVTIPRGEMVGAVIASANRLPSQVGGQFSRSLGKGLGSGPRQFLLPARTG
jgi:hypothetical protein